MLVKFLVVTIFGYINILIHFLMLDGVTVIVLAIGSKVRRFKQTKNDGF
jgi:hypothetical protein